MGQPSVPPAPPPLVPTPSPSPAPAAGAAGAAGGGGCQVRCAGCRMILNVGPGLTEFVCPTCQLPQMLPPELMRAPPHRSVPAHGIDPTKIQLPCAQCKAILNVPHGLSRFSCPQCGVDLAVDVSKLKHFFPLPPRQLPPPPPPPEEVNEDEDCHPLAFLPCSESNKNSKMLSEKMY